MAFTSILCILAVCYSPCDLFLVWRSRASHVTSQGYVELKWLFSSLLCILAVCYSPCDLYLVWKSSKPCDIARLRWAKMLFSSLLCLLAVCYSPCALFGVKVKSKPCDIARLCSAKMLFSSILCILAVRGPIFGRFHGMPWPTNGSLNKCLDSRFFYIDIYIF